MANNNNMLQICRLCLVKDDVNIPIFEDQGDIRQIFLKISSCLPVKVAREDRLPKKICDGCSYKLDMLYEFWNTSANAEKQLLSWLGEAGVPSKMADGALTAVAQQMKPAEAFVKEETLELPDGHADDDDKEYLFAQQKVEESASAGPSATVTSNEDEEPPPKRARRTAAVKAAIAMDQESDDDDDSGEPLTKIEDESEDSDGEDHVPAFVDVPSTSADDQPGPSGVGKDGVEAPEKQSRRKSKPKKNITPEVKRRKKIKKPEGDTEKPIFLDTEITIPKQELPEFDENYLKFACELCDEKIDSSVRFAIHSISHSSDKKYHCHYCKHKSSTLKRITKHMRAHGNVGEDFRCSLCSADFPECIQAIEHKNIHSGEMPYRCAVCEKHFMFSWLLFTHTRLFHADGTASTSALFCDTCQMSFGTKSGLTKHMFRKHSKRPKESPLCDVCGKTLANSETLKFHKRTHTGEKPYTCTTCGKSFRKKGLLVEHERIHTGEKPFACQYCDKAFAQRAPLKIHRRIHTGERPYICRLCGKGCICKSVLDSHMKSCSGVVLV